MARPLKDGVDYWPLDIDFLTCDEIRLIRAQYGAKGVLIAIALINECYKSAGYFKQWDDDCCLLMADAVSCGITPELISQVVQECVRRGLFNEDVFSGFRVLTSAGIQRRYLRMLNNRNEIEIISEYWLLDIESKKDVPAGVVNKIIFKYVKSNSKGNESNFKPDKTSGNEQSKEKESKENPPISPPTEKIPHADIIGYLNKKANKDFRVCDSHKRYICARWNDGFRIEHFKRVVDNQCARWNREPEAGKEDMRMYLRPETLFGNKFQSYLNQPNVLYKSGGSDLLADMGEYVSGNR